MNTYKDLNCLEIELVQELQYNLCICTHQDFYDQYAGCIESCIRAFNPTEHPPGISILSPLLRGGKIHKREHSCHTVTPETSRSCDASS
jgi:hypothetical protein